MLLFELFIQTVESVPSNEDGGNGDDTPTVVQYPLTLIRVLIIYYRMDRDETCVVAVSVDYDCLTCINITGP